MWARTSTSVAGWATIDPGDGARVMPVAASVDSDATSRSTPAPESS